MLNFEKKGILPLIKEEFKLKEDAGKWFICGKRILQKLVKKVKIIAKLEIIAIVWVNIKAQHRVFVI